MQHETDWRKIVKLDCLERPGLSERDFYALFAKCDACWQVIARRVFDHHECRPLGVDGLKLTDCEEKKNNTHIESGDLGNGTSTHDYIRQELIEEMLKSRYRIVTPQLRIS